MGCWWRFLLQEFRTKGIFFPPPPEGVFIAVVSDNDLFFQPVELWNQGPLKLSQAIPKSHSGYFGWERLYNNIWLNCFEHIGMVCTGKLNIWFLDAKLGSWHRVRHTWANKHFSLQNQDDCIRFPSETGPWRNLTAELCLGIAWESAGQHRWKSVPRAVLMARRCGKSHSQALSSLSA